MHLADLLIAERIVIPLKTKTLRGATNELLGAVLAADPSVEGDELEQRVTDALTGRPERVGDACILSFRTDALPALTVALGVAKVALKLEEEEKAVRIVLLIAAPPRKSSQFLQALGAFSRALGRKEVRDGLLAAKSADDVVGLAALQDVEFQGYLMVRDVMVRRQISVSPDTPLGEVSRVMVQHDAPAVTVVSDTDEVLGMVTHRELLQHLLPHYVKRMNTGEFHGARPGSPDVQDPHELPVREIMDRSVLCVSEDQVLGDVATMMLNRNIDRFPVVRDGALVGVLTRADIVRNLFGT